MLMYILDVVHSIIRHIQFFCVIHYFALNCQELLRQSIGIDVELSAANEIFFLANYLAHNGVST